MTILSDPNILVSMINMKLRDGNYESLSDACLSLDLDEKLLVEKLSGAGFVYYPDIKQFR